MASQGSEALPSLPFVFLLGWVYFYDFFPICLFFFGFFFFSSCLYVSMCFVFSAGLGVGRVFLLCSNFPPKTWAGAGCAAHPDEGAGRGKKSFLSQIPGLAGPRGDTAGEGERERESEVRLCRCPHRPLPHPRPVTSVSPTQVCHHRAG